MPDRSRRAWYVVPLFLVIGIVSGVSVMVQAEKAPAAPSVHTSSAAATPVLSARRVPDLVAAPVAGRRLAAHLDDLMTQVPEATCLTVAIDGHVVYSRNPTLPLTPASIEKMMTAQAALAVLGPQAVLTTDVRAANGPANGVLDGNLWMVGGGDPLLMTNAYVQHFKHQPVVHSDLETLADRIVAAGINHITGSVVGDDSRYDEQRYLPQWPARFQTAAETGPLGALTVNDALAAFPPSPDVKTPIATPAADPAQHAADQLTQLLGARGVVVDGAPTAGKAPDGATDIAQLESQPISDMVSAMLTESDNGTAELLTKEMGLHDSGAGTTAAGVAAITKALQGMGLPLDGTTQFDGSGLASENKETCAIVQGLLDQQGPGSALGTGLPIAGQTGTLDVRLLDPSTAGRVRAKTGTLNQVTSLAGYVTTIQGAQLSFTMMINVAEPQKVTTADVDLEDELAKILVQYPENVDVSQLGPRS